MSVTGRALWYIESHLREDLSTDSIARAIGVSPFHLSRAFSASTGRPLMNYARARRLSEAARLLADGAPDILDVAIQAGYGSHEAFTRAFRQGLDATPERVRAEGSTRHLSLQEPLRLSATPLTPVPTPRLVNREAFLLFGLNQHYRAGANAGIPAQWGRFGPHLGHIAHEVPGVTYGVVFNVDSTNNFDYLCAVEVTDFPAQPVEFTRLRVTAQRYAVFEHREHIASIQSTFIAIWDRGLEAAGLKAIDAPVLERYDERFDPATGFGGLEIWVPVGA